MRASTTEEVILKFVEKHGDRYNYSHVIYKNMQTKIKIVCLEHGTFEQLPFHHIAGRGCRKCANKIINLNNGKGFSQDKFIEIVTAKNIPNISFEKTIYLSKRNRVIVTCSIHGDYTTLAEILLKGNGCKKCASAKLKLDRLDTTQGFISKSLVVHKDLYDYSKVDYKGCFIKVDILCKKHNRYFSQTPATHIKNSGCPLCKTSKGELKILYYLDSKSIMYERQKSFKGLILERTLKFDFYLPNYNLCIEYDGEQHFKPLSDHWGGEEGFRKRQLKDSLKDSYCKINNISLLRIRFDEDIEERLDTFLLSLKTII